ncbi:carotenoid oxygenase family protein [Gloeothece verrucosa]|uniref:Carotenoid oxygenase n=1 Tax=Gloeothece verrucosa (strain PCC 7822) TaxID=497965 RepID=E0UBK6_GLOV7|nr:carotenoid oxygenase family protein [Gloeothece verrucosa]ADN13950.1 Carotenoid oxygenase [Gloeothece verrucosa PCC 7822]
MSILQQLPLKHKAWSKAISKPAQEFSLTPLSILSGQIPTGLRGSLYRNTSARLERGGKRVGHWFDGDGAILAVHFTDEGATGVYRYIQTRGYQTEALADQFLYPNYGMTVPGPFWKSWGKEVKNTANTSVLALNDRLLALWEGGWPHSLDLQTLETFKKDNLSWLKTTDLFSAHPKIDPNTGYIYNFGVSLGLSCVLQIYQCDAQGNLLARASHRLSGLPLIHDFVLAGDYLIFFVSPVRIKAIPVLLGLKSYSEAMEWKPEIGTKILIFNRHNLSLISQSEADPWYQWHYANGYMEQDGTVAVDFVHYGNFQTNQYLKEIATGKTETLAKGTLYHVRLNPVTGKIIEMFSWMDRACEFPLVPPHQQGKPWRYTYLSVHREGVDIAEEILGAIAKFDHKKGHLSIADMGDNCYPCEPIFVPSQPGSEQGWVLTVVYDGNHHCSEVRIYDSEHLEDEPLCRLLLPSVVALGFHGTWKPA